MKVRKASERKSLQGLDNIPVEGAAAFVILEKLVDDLEQAGVEKLKLNDLRRRIQEGKNYLKTDYKVHCKAKENECADHWHKFALSDQHDKDFQCSCSHQHNVVCPECDDLKKLFIDIKALIDKYYQDSILMTRKTTCYMILEKLKSKYSNGKAHTLRSIDQETAKQEIFESLEKSSALIVMDWTMKFTRLRHREKQSDWFARRGLSWHISSIICKGHDGQFQVFSYTYLFDICIQD